MLTIVRVLRSFEILQFKEDLRREVFKNDPSQDSHEFPACLFRLRLGSYGGTTLEAKERTVPGPVLPPSHSEVKKRCVR